MAHLKKINIADVIADYNRDVRVKFIAEKHGCTTEAVYAALRRAGVIKMWAPRLTTEQLRRARRLLGCTLEEFATIIGVCDKQTIWRWEHEREKLTNKHSYQIYCALKKRKTEIAKWMLYNRRIQQLTRLVQEKKYDRRRRRHRQKRESTTNCKHLPRNVTPTPGRRIDMDTYDHLVEDQNQTGSCQPHRGRPSTQEHCEGISLSLHPADLHLWERVKAYHAKHLGIAVSASAVFVFLLRREAKRLKIKNK